MADIISVIHGIAFGRNILGPKRRSRGRALDKMDKALPLSPNKSAPWPRAAPAPPAASDAQLVAQVAELRRSLSSQSAQLLRVIERLDQTLNCNPEQEAAHSGAGPRLQLVCR